MAIHRRQHRVVDVDPRGADIDDLAGFETAAGTRDRMEDPGQLAFDIVVPTITRFGGNRDAGVFQDRLAVGLAGFIQSLEEVRYFAHLHVRVSPQLLILLSGIESVPPLVTAAARSGFV